MLQETSPINTNIQFKHIQNSMHSHLFVLSWFQFKIILLFSHILYNRAALKYILKNIWHCYLTSLSLNQQFIFHNFNIRISYPGVIQELKFFLLFSVCDSKRCYNAESDDFYKWIDTCSLVKIHNRQWYKQSVQLKLVQNYFNYTSVSFGLQVDIYLLFCFFAVQALFEWEY